MVAGVFDNYGWVEDLPVSNSLPDLVQHPAELHFDPKCLKETIISSFPFFTLVLSQLRTTAKK
jgi:hypothetical protein